MEKKIFDVRLKGIDGGKWISITERSYSNIFSLDFEKEEIFWLLEQLKNASKQERSLGFIKKFKGKT